jgi:hypothetical protein
MRAPEAGMSCSWSRVLEVIVRGRSGEVLMR